MNATRTALTLGRRASDQWIADLLQSVIVRTQMPKETPIPAKTVQSPRSPRRTKKQLRDALARAKKLVQAEHLAWSPQRVGIRAMNMVRRREVV